MEQNFSNFDEWTEVARTGNYLVKEAGDEEMHWYVVKPAMGAFALVYRNDHPMHVAIDGYLSEQVPEDALDTLIHLQVMMMNIMPDAQFIGEFSKIYTECVMRNTNVAINELSEEEVLREDEAAEELAERIENMQQ